MADYFLKDHKPSVRQGEARLRGTRTPKATLSTIAYRLSAIAYWQDSVGKASVWHSRSHPVQGLFIAGYTALALALGALVIALRGYDFLLFILIWPVILSAMLVPWRMYLILIGIGVTVTAITLPLVVPDLNRSATTAAAATTAAFLICESVYRVMRRQRAMARAVQESEARFRCTFERAPAPMAITDVHGRLKWFNQRLLMQESR